MVIVFNCFFFLINVFLRGYDSYERNSNVLKKNWVWVNQHLKHPNVNDRYLGISKFRILKGGKMSYSIFLFSNLFLFVCMYVYLLVSLRVTRFPFRLFISSVSSLSSPVFTFSFSFYIFFIIISYITFYLIFLPYSTFLRTPRTPRLLYFSYLLILMFHT